MRFAVVSLVTLALAACGSDATTSDEVETQGTPSSCNLTVDLGYCLDFGPEAPKDTAKSNCENAKTGGNGNAAVNETAACPTEKRVGSCTSTSDGVTAVFRYYVGTFTEATAKDNCKQIESGKFTSETE